MIFTCLANTNYNYIYNVIINNDADDDDACSFCADLNKTCGMLDYM